MSMIRRFLKQQRSFRSLEQEIYVGLQLVADRLAEPMERMLRERADLTMVQYNVLRILRGAAPEGLWASEIAGRMITRSPDVTRIVDRLEKRGLVRRGRDPADGRAVRVHITDAGLEQMRPFDDLAPGMTGLGHLDEQRLETLRDTLDAILGGLPPDPDG